MAFTGDAHRASKADRASLLALAVAALLTRAGERIGLADGSLPPRTGHAQVVRLAEALAAEGAADYGTPQAEAMAPRGRAVFLSDFLGDPAPVESALTRAADQGVRGVLLQVLDPQEESFPFDGRTIFESMAGELRHETLRAADLRSRYIDRLAARKERLKSLARVTGWQFSSHHTDEPAAAALLWLYRALERRL
jgi:uncharacterized protein (DUF58 family)